MFETKRNHIESRWEFEHNLNLLAEISRRGNLNISSGSINLIKGLQMARVLPNRRIDFNTINESVRATSMTVSQMANKFKLDDEKE